MKSILIIGMGMLGQCLATRMQELGNDVMVIDRDEDKIQELSTVFPAESNLSLQAVLRFSQMDLSPSVPVPVALLPVPMFLSEPPLTMPLTMPLAM